MLLLKRKNALATYGVLLILLLVGTSSDLLLSESLYAPDSPFTGFFAAYGELPALLCAWTGSACLLASVEGRRDRKATVIRWVSGIVMAVSAGVSLLYKPYTFISRPITVLGTIVEGLIAIAAFAWVTRNAERADRKLLGRVGTVLVLVAVGNVLVVTVTKIPWGRPRYRSVISTDGLDYRPWYVPGTDDREAFEGILPHEEFKSFPSGHTANAACALALLLLLYVIPSLRERERALTAFAFAWTALVMAARITAGAHFLSDVTVGLAVTFTLTVLLAHKFLQTKETC